MHKTDPLRNKSGRSSETTASTNEDRNTERVTNFQVISRVTYSLVIVRQGASERNARQAKACLRCFQCTDAEQQGP